MRLCDKWDERIPESDVMEEEVISGNAKPEYIEYMPFVKGTSNEHKRVSILEREIEVVAKNDESSVLNVVNWGRSL